MTSRPAVRAWVGEVCRLLGISAETYYRWKAHVGGLQVAEANQLKALEV